MKRMNFPNRKERRKAEAEARHADHKCGPTCKKNRKLNK
jgi:hypothetical protein